MVWLVRVMIWLVAVIAAVAIVIAFKYGAHQVFFQKNPHFTLQNVSIEIVKGAISEREVRDNIGILPEMDNIFDVDLNELRQALLLHPLVQEVEIRRRLPDMVHFKVYGRTPVAQLIISGGRLIDSEGIVLPANATAEARDLPVITGIPRPKSHQIGKPIQDSNVLSALRFLKLKKTLKRGHLLDVDFIQLERNEQFRVNLHGKSKYYIRDGAVVVIPTRDIEIGLRKTFTILDEQIAARELTAFIDATYDRAPVK